MTLGERVLQLPPTAVAILRQRFLSGARLDQPVFPDVLGGFRDPANVRREIREARGEETLAWITSHTFRKTAATLLDEASLSARVVADQLGHSRPSMTQDVYLGRRVQAGGAAARAGGRPQGCPDRRKRWQSDGFGRWPCRVMWRLTWGFVRHQGLEPRTR
jgi:integrase